MTVFLKIITVLLNYKNTLKKPHRITMGSLRQREAYDETWKHIRHTIAHREAHHSTQEHLTARKEHLTHGTISAHRGKHHSTQEHTKSTSETHIITHFALLLLRGDAH